jgi:hypothetical protein
MLAEPEDRVQMLGPVAHELGLMPLAAVDAGAAVATVAGQQPFEQCCARPAHRRADRGFQPVESFGAAGRIQQRCRLLCQLGDLDPQRGGQFVDEPPISSCAPRSSSRSTAGGARSRASQIVSLTSTTCRETSTNRR